MIIIRYMNLLLKETKRQISKTKLSNQDILGKKCWNGRKLALSLVVRHLSGGQLLLWESQKVLWSLWLRMCETLLVWESWCKTVSENFLVKPLDTLWIVRRGWSLLRLMLNQKEEGFENGRSSPVFVCQKMIQRRLRPCPRFLFSSTSFSFKIFYFPVDLLDPVVGCCWLSRVLQASF